MKQDIFSSMFFLGGPPICLLVVGICLKRLGTSFLMNLFENFTGFAKEPCGTSCSVSEGYRSS